MAKKNYYQKQTAGMLNASIGTMVGVGLIGATAPMVQALPVGTARTIAGTAVGLQGVALLGPSLKYANDSLGINSRPRRKVRRY
jgi:hypothetical protein